MYMYDLYVAEFDNGDKMTGSISQVYAAQEVKPGTDSQRAPIANNGRQPAGALA